MHRTALALVAALLAACGSSSPSPPLYQGFTPLEGTAVVFPRATCDVAFVGTTSAVGVAITLTDFAGVCSFLTDTAMCGSRADSTFVVAAAVDGVVGGTAPDVPRLGTYPLLANPPTGAFRAAIGSAVRTTSTCTSQPNTSLDMIAGSIEITEITETRVKGALNLAFEDGSAYRQPFDLLRCAPPAGICTLIEFGSCLPGFPPWTCVGAP